MKVSAKLIEDITQKDGHYFLPARIRIAIENCLECDNGDLITSEYGHLLKDYRKHITLHEPAVIDYKNSLTLDAYTTFYFSRNFCIPLIGLRDLVYHPLFQNLPSEIKVLDIGSGTGAVVLGLLWLFDQKPLSNITVEITSIDSCVEALNRQRSIILDAGFQMDRIGHHEVDIGDTENFTETITKDGPFNLIFAANCLTETPEPDAQNMAQRLQKCSQMTVPLLLLKHRETT